MAHWPYYGGFGPTLVGVIWALFAVSTVQILLRIFTKFRLVKHSGGWCLSFACLAWVLAMVSNVLYTYCMYWGLGNRVEQFVEIPPTIMSNAIYVEWVAANLVCYSSFFGRLSAALFMFEILGPTHKIGRWVISFIVAVNGISYIVTTAMIYTQCSPSNKLWKPELPGNCDGEPRAYKWAVFTGSWSAFADMAIALYPIYIIYRLQIRLGLKVLVCGLMGLGVFTSVCSIMKTIMLKKLNGTGIAHLMIWGAVEMWVVLIASSFAPLQPLLREWARKTKAVSSWMLVSNIFSQKIDSFGSRKSLRGDSNNEKSLKTSRDSQASTIDVGNDTIEKRTDFEVESYREHPTDVEARASQSRQVAPWESN